MWWATTGSYRPGHLGLLDDAERDRWARLRRDDDRRRLAVGAVMLRLAAAELSGVPAGSVRVDRTCDGCGAPHGRPQLPGTGLFASVSHSADRVAVAVTDVAPLGVDVEAVVPGQADALRATVLGAGEQAGSDAEFFVYWTRKEAAVKATGDGLRVPLRDVLVSAPGAPAALRSYPGRPHLVAAMTDLAPGEGYAAALAVLHPEPGPVRQIDGTTSLAGVPRR